ncbi:hypothetical protein UFOVP116_290 [uncultured Caudovirales phage]|uniref:Uncharacterized protein n=1 Tax=uncultured Caudovirales phage TaxID=2100421 RepID=A0A6J5L6V8_9CAUD|nr:hypothetical protein UFOVP116_290 [uncultured Caudovirales phage]
MQSAIQTTLNKKYSIAAPNSVIGFGTTNSLYGYDRYWVRLQVYTNIGFDQHTDFNEILHWCTHHFGPADRDDLDDSITPRPRWWKVWDKISFRDEADRTMFLLRWGG